MRTVSIWILVATALISGSIWLVGKGHRMGSAWAILLISAATDFVITFATGLQVGNAATQTAYPSGPTLLYSAIGGLVVAARTVQQALKSTTADSAALRGVPVVTVTKTPGQSEIVGPAEPGQAERSAQHVMDKH